MRLKEWVLDVIFPKLCLGCGEEGKLFCPSCRSGFVFRAPTCPVCSRRNFTGILCASCADESGLRRFLAPFSYSQGMARDLIHAYKYDGVRELALIFADEIAAFLNFYAIKPAASSLLVPIPLHRSRERERGFNQAGLLAKALAKKLNLVMYPVLRRRYATDSQIDMTTYDDRKKNVAGAFGIKDPLAIAGKTVILVDDVSTSGATLHEAAKTLRTAGARSVWAIVIAKG